MPLRDLQEQCPGTLTFTNTGANGLAAGNTVTFVGFTGGAATLNGTTGTVLAAGLSATTFEVTTAATTTASTAGLISVPTVTTSANWTTYAGTITGGGIATSGCATYAYQTCLPYGGYAGIPAVTVAGFTTHAAYSGTTFPVIASSTTNLVVVNAAAAGLAVDTEAATINSTAVVNSPALNFAAGYGTGAGTEGIDKWSCTDVMGSVATNPTSTLTCTHTGSSGTASVSLPALSVNGVATSGSVASATQWSPAYYGATGTSVQGTTPFTGFEFWPGTAAPRAGAWADLYTSIYSTLSGCTTAGYLSSPGSGNCVAPPTGTVPSSSTTPVSNAGLAPITTTPGTATYQSGNPVAANVLPDTVASQTSTYASQATAIGSVTDTNAKTALTAMNNYLLSSQAALQNNGIIIPNALQALISTATCTNCAVYLLNSTSATTGAASITNYLTGGNAATLTQTVQGTGYPNFNPGGPGTAKLGGYLNFGQCGGYLPVLMPTTTTYQSGQTWNLCPNIITSSGQVQGGGNLTGTTYPYYAGSTTSAFTLNGLSGAIISVKYKQNLYSNGGGGSCLS